MYEMTTTDRCCVQSPFLSLTDCQLCSKTMDIDRAYVGLEVVEGVADIILPLVQMQNVAGFSYTVPTGSCRNPNPKRHTCSQLSCKVS